MLKITDASGHTKFVLSDDDVSPIKTKEEELEQKKKEERKEPEQDVPNVD